MAASSKMDELHHNLIKCVSCHRLLSSDNTESVDPPLPGRKLYFNEANEVKRSRLIYQSRKRGTLENGLIFSTFAARYLNSMSPLHLDLYDKLLNEPSNEWDIYYWITGNKPTPSEYDNEVMRMLKEHARNSQKEVRNQMPNL